ncbi:cytoplasmic protein [Bacillus sp. M6-12]|uniref:DUF1697 domain-containing protein n=1 Tax=Bacillus sp. M6-12 TaxID=2054166 RepID=UPI000C772FC9|nr:DUF1697 domain-containing protein [Bacillus sp. M6-12]PLS16622.1 cytoplasmic protein [Bacillus sp. M6-12]
MAVYIALLRGINVGGHNKIKMADLRSMFETIGISPVQTYIQSGNVLFESNENEEFLREQIERKIKTVFGCSVTVILRTASELEKIMNNCPFSAEEIIEAEASSEGECLYVSLMIEAPSQKNVERLNSSDRKLDKYIIEGRNIYLLFHQSVRNSKLASNLNKLDTPATMRNWKTMNKLAAMAKSIES